MTHDLIGQSHFYDRIRRMMIATNVELQVNDDEARVLVSPLMGGRAEAVLYDHPLIISALERLAAAFEEIGAEGADRPVGVKANWMICPKCDRRGGIENNYGDWHECATCEGAGTIIIRD